MTPADVREGRRLLSHEANTSGMVQTISKRHLAEWLWAHRAKLLDAAEGEERERKMRLQLQVAVSHARLAADDDGPRKP